MFHRMLCVAVILASAAAGWLGANLEYSIGGWRDLSRELHQGHEINWSARE